MLPCATEEMPGLLRFVAVGGVREVVSTMGVSGRLAPQL